MELIFGGVGLLIVAYLFAFPYWRRREIERDRKRRPAVVPAGGLIAPFDEVFHPSAYEANLIWDAETQLPAPAPDSDGSRPDLGTGKIVITVADSGAEEGVRASPGT